MNRSRVGVFDRRAGVYFAEDVRSELLAALWHGYVPNDEAALHRDRRHADAEPFRLIRNVRHLPELICPGTSLLVKDALAERLLQRGLRCRPVVFEAAYNMPQPLRHADIPEEWHDRVLNCHTRHIDLNEVAATVHGVPVPDVRYWEVVSAIGIHISEKPDISVETADLGHGVFHFTASVSRELVLREGIAWASAFFCREDVLDVLRPALLEQFFTAPRWV